MAAKQTRADSHRGTTIERHVGDIQCPQLRPILVGLCGVTAAAVLSLTSYTNFYYDEWDFISWFRPWNLSQLFWPHNEHWSTLPILIWKLLFIAFGLKSHIPFEGALLAAHVAGVILLFTLIRRRSGDIPAFAAALILLVLGSGGTDIVWAFQIGFVGSVAFGLLALFVLEGNPPIRNVVGGSAALLGSLMCSGVGLAFLVAFTVELLFHHRRRRYLLAVVVPIAGFVAWYIAFDTGAVPGLPGTSTSLHYGAIGWGYVGGLLRFVTYGLEAAAAGLVGLPAAVGVVVLPTLTALVALHWYRQRKVYGWQLAMVAGAVGWFSVTGLGRAQNGPSAAGDSHYLYIGVVFLLPLIVDAAKELPWHGVWRPVLTAALAFALFINIVQLWNYTRIQVDTMRVENAELQTVEVFRGAPDMALYRPLDSVIMPQLVAARYFAAIDELGSPVPPATFDTLKHLPADAVDRVMVNLFGQALGVTADITRSTVGLTCRTVDSTGGSTMDFLVPSGQSFMLRPTRAGDGSLYLSFLGPQRSVPLQDVRLTASPEWVHLPNTGKPLMWQLRIKTMAIGILQVCGVASFEYHDDRIREAKAPDGALGPGWSSTIDSAASGGRAAKAAMGAAHFANGSYGNDTFGPSFIPSPGTYDLWFRVRIANADGVAPEMTLGLWDEGGSGAWRGSTTYKANQIGMDYTWVKAAASVIPAEAHPVQFQATIESKLSTDWFIDEAILIPTGSPPPT